LARRFDCQMCWLFFWWDMQSLSVFFLMSGHQWPSFDLSFKGGMASSVLFVCFCSLFFFRCKNGTRMYPDPWALVHQPNCYDDLDEGREKSTKQFKVGWIMLNPYCYFSSPATWIWISMIVNKISGWWFGTFLFSHRLGIIITTDLHIFQRNWNHQPDIPGNDG
jgi:hypothetical protein